MRRLFLLGMFFAVLTSSKSMQQERPKGNAFIVPSTQQESTPAKLAVDIIFKEPSGNGILEPGETGQLVVAVVNAGGSVATDVTLTLRAASPLPGVTFGKTFLLGTIDAAQQKTVAISVSMLGSETITSHKGIINVVVAEGSTQQSLVEGVIIETAARDKSAGRNVFEAPQAETREGRSMNPTPSDKLPATIRELRVKLANSPKDDATKRALIEQLFQAHLYTDVVLESKGWVPLPQSQPSHSLYLIGESYRQLKQYESALDYLLRGLSTTQSPEVGLSESYAMTLLHLSRVGEAVDILEVVSKIDTTFVSNELALADRHFQENDFKSAADEYLSVFVVDRSKLTSCGLSFVKFMFDYRNLLKPANANTAKAGFVDIVRKKLGDSLYYDELARALDAMVVSDQVTQAQTLYREILNLEGAHVGQDTLDKTFLAVGYKLAASSPDLLKSIRIAFIREIKALYDLDDEDVKTVYSLHELVLNQGLLGPASEITRNLIEGASHPHQRYVALSDIFLKYKRNMDAVGTFNLMVRKKGLDKFPYAADLTKLYESRISAQQMDEASNLMSRIESLNEKDITSTYSTLAEILTKAGKLEESINTLQALIQHDPGNVSLGVKLGDALLASGRFDDIIYSFANVTTMQGRRYLAIAYEKKYLLAEANRAWEDFRKLTQDPAEAAEAKKHIDDNLIAMMSPDYARLKAEANKPKIALTAAAEFKILIDAPDDGLQTDSNSIEVSGRVLGAVTLRDVKINGISVGLPRAMKATGPSAQQVNAASDTARPGIPYRYIVNLNPGKNEVEVKAFAASGDSASARIAVMSQPPARPMTVEEADGIRQTKAYAVIIGIDKYKDPGIRGLNYTVNDAEELAKTLTDPRYGGFKKENVTLLLNSDATTKNIKMAIGVDLKRAPEDGLAVIFFAGHGAPEGEKTYWLTYDADPNSLYASSLSNDEIADMLGRINTKRIVTLLDCCYSGASITASRSTRAVVIEDPFKLLEGSGSITITSSNGKEQSLEDATLRHGIFTYRLLEAVKGKADYNEDGIVMADEIARYIKEKVPSDARERSHKQDPVVVANYSGYIPISRNAENVLKNSKTAQLQHFMDLYRDQKIDGTTLKKVQRIIEGDDENAKQPIKDYFNGVFNLKDLLSILSK
jgi:tetratricopeptide (TPR) repeat protein